MDEIIRPLLIAMLSAGKFSSVSWFKRSIVSFIFMLRVVGRMAKVILLADRVRVYLHVIMMAGEFFWVKF